MVKNHPTMQYFFILLIFSFLFYNCATIFHGSTEKINLKSSPTDAKVSINGVFTGNTPLELDLKTKPSYRIEFSKDGYDHKVLLLNSSVGDTWIILDIFGGIFAPMFVDELTGSWYTFNEKDFSVTLRDPQATVISDTTNESNGEIPFSTDKPLLVNSLPEKIVDAVLQISATDEADTYELNGDIVIVGDNSILFAASVIKIGPSLTIPVFSRGLRLGNFGGAFEGSYDNDMMVGKMQIASPIETEFYSNVEEYIESGPAGCTLKRTEGKGLILIEGKAYLLKKKSK